MIFKFDFDIYHKMHLFTISGYPGLPMYINRWRLLPHAYRHGTILAISKTLFEEYTKNSRNGRTYIIPLWFSSLFPGRSIENSGDIGFERERRCAWRAFTRGYRWELECYNNGLFRHRRPGLIFTRWASRPWFSDDDFAAPGLYGNTPDKKVRNRD